MSGWGRALVRRGFGEPSGMVGRFGGCLMVRANGATERHLTHLAGIEPGETVLVVGSGPGVGVRATLEASARVVAVDPSPLMLESTLRRCRDLLANGHDLTLRAGTAQDTGQAPASVDVALSVNNVMIWPDRGAGLRELHRVLRPGGRLLISGHDRWLPDGLTDDCVAAGFVEVESWAWEPPGGRAGTARQVRARLSGP